MYHCSPNGAQAGKAGTPPCWQKPLCNQTQPRLAMHTSSHAVPPTSIVPKLPSEPV